MKRQPFEEGWDAGMRGYKNPEVICRYEKHTKEWQEWHKFYEWAVEFRNSGDPPRTKLENLREWAKEFFLK